MAYVIWKIFMKQYSRFRFDLATTSPSSAGLLIRHPLTATYNQPAILANPQPSPSNDNNNSSNNNNSVSSGQNSNISGNSTTRPPEGEEQEVAAVTVTPATVQLYHNDSNTHSCSNNSSNIASNEEHLVEVLVVPANDTKTIATKTALKESTVVEVATKNSTNAADVEAAFESLNGDRNVANETATMAGRGNAIAPIAREEEDTVEVWSSEGEDGTDVEMAESQPDYCCCLVNNTEESSQVDANSKVNPVATITGTSTLAVTVTLASTTTTATSLMTEKSVQRSKSRVRTYLKKCRDRLTGQHQQVISSENATTTAGCSTYLEDEKSKVLTVTEVLKVAPNRNASELSGEEEACTCILIATTEQQQNEAVEGTLLTLTEEAEEEEEASEEEGTAAEAAAEVNSASELTELVYEDIDFSLSSVLMDSSSSNVSDDQHQSTPLTSAHNRDALTLAADVDDSGDLPVECKTSEQQQQQQKPQTAGLRQTQSQKSKKNLVARDEEEGERQQQQNQQQKQPLMCSYNSCPPLVKEEQLAHAVRMDSSTAALIDKHLAAIYPVYAACTREILIRQARDLLVSSYSACLESFEIKFLCKFAEIAAELRQRHAIGVVSNAILVCVVVCTYNVKVLMGNT
ncbi:general transcriptional corepressor trfA-like isoform X2 [Anastrepha ludens]|uniref:general transcriptional corepressor trfA-like isoform X2 n=1 Tax=Anastrepha ludens TaxID=28586 RepID=UPI0023B05BFE|nr:general transcriptional corepressor trfA-like isoform X2 [Anastrepha ludens]